MQTTKKYYKIRTFWLVGKLLRQSRSVISPTVSIGNDTTTKL